MKFAEDRRSDGNQIISQSGVSRGPWLVGASEESAFNAIDQMIQFGRTIVLLEPDTLFASATFDVKRYCILNSRSGVRYRTAAAAGKFP